MGRIVKYRIGFKVSDYVAERIITELISYANAQVGGPYITSIDNFQRLPDSTTFDIVMPTIGADTTNLYTNTTNNIITPFIQGLIYAFDVFAIPQ